MSSARLHWSAGLSIESINTSYQCNLSKNKCTYLDARRFARTKVSTHFQILAIVFPWSSMLRIFPSSILTQRRQRRLPILATITLQGHNCRTDYGKSSTGRKFNYSFVWKSTERQFAVFMNFNQKNVHVYTLARVWRDRGEKTEGKTEARRSVKSSRRETARKSIGIDKRSIISTGDFRKRFSLRTS